MRYINLCIAIATSIVLASCGSSDSETQTTPPATLNGSTTPDTTSTSNTTTPGTIPAPTIATTPGTLSTQSAATTNSGINPPHGQPGHRCDIAEGAPLNGKPAAPAVTTPTVSSSPATISQPVVTQNTPAINSSKTAAGINPAHGQPGHRCDIAVGASLDSKPIQASIQQPATTTNPTPATSVLPYTPTTTQPAAASVAKGMNPAHGQPGHRCDISVGAPLDSKPITPVVTTEANKPKQ